MQVGIIDSEIGNSFGCVCMVQVTNDSTNV
jgi:hypothetical protein